MKNDARVLFIVSQPFYRWRGSPIRVKYDVEALVANGYKVDLLTLPFGEDCSIEGVSIIRVGNPLRFKEIPIGPSLPKLWFDFALYGKARKLLSEHRYVALHGVEDAGMVCALLGKQWSIPYVFEKHSDPDSHKQGFLRNRVMSLYRELERIMIRRACAVIATGPGLKDQARAVDPTKPVFHVSDLPSSRSVCDPAGVQQARERMQASGDDILVTYVGSFAVYQGIEVLFGAIPLVCREAPTVRFVIIGGSDAEIRERRRQMEEAGAVEGVCFMGTCAPDVLPNYLRASDILLSPRISGTNTPLKLLDYLKAGRAIVATDMAANRQILDEQTAVFATMTAKGLADAILKLVHDPRLRQSLSECGQQLVAERYHFDCFKEQIGHVYQTVDQE